ncbi:hypothetical protein IAU60_004991 [Kwoniella sp. DSM 27419]
MVSQADIGPVSSHYAAAATVPLIKSPSLWLPKPIEMPNDIHPLPDDITAYFVYPFTLEEHVLSIRPSPAEAISQRRARNAEILHQREVEEEQKEKDNMRRMAPGYNPAAMLVPSSTGRAGPTSGPATGDPAQSALAETEPAELNNLSSLAGLTFESTPDPPGVGNPGVTGPADPMDEMIAQLEQMDPK